MKIGVFFTGIIPLFIFTACWVDEAPSAKQQRVTVVSDFLTASDSSLIEDFSKKFKTTVTITVIPADSIYLRFYTQRYNSGIDVLITDNQSLRNKLKQLSAFRRLDETLFRKVDRQFYESHHLWLAITHDPLILVTAKDTTGNCKLINWQTWHQKDSLRPAIKWGKNPENYRALLSDHPRFSLLTETRKIVAPYETVYPLSSIVAYRNDPDSLSPLPVNGCFYYLVYNKRYVSAITSASICKYSPNVSSATRFVRYYAANAWAVANNRNHLPVNKDVHPNWNVSNLNIH